MSGEIEQHSEQTRGNRQGVLDRFAWWIEGNSIERCDTEAVRAFLQYCGHCPRWPGYSRVAPTKPGTVASYYRILRAFFNWLIREELLDHSPLRKIDPPIDRQDQMDPLSHEHIRALRLAALKSSYRSRDEAVLHFLLDTGVRVTELVTLAKGNLDITGRSARVYGKGGKERTVYFANRTARKLFAYMQEENRPDGQLFFAGERGALTRSGVQQILDRLAKRAGLSKIHPHRFRHTFAVEFLRAGGDWGTLQALLGHSDHRMTQRYVKFAEADIERGHRRCSPVERHYAQGNR